MGARSTNAEIDLRVREVQALILDGCTRSAIVQFGSKWGVSDRQIDDYIKAATERITEHNLSTLQLDMSIVTSQLWNLFRQAREIGNVTEQRQILTTIAKLKGLNRDPADCKVALDKEAELRREAIRRLSNEELDALLAEYSND